MEVKRSDIHMGRGQYRCHNRYNLPERAEFLPTKRNADSSFGSSVVLDGLVGGRAGWLSDREGHFVEFSAFFFSLQLI